MEVIVEASFTHWRLSQFANAYSPIVLPGMLTDLRDVHPLNAFASIVVTEPSTASESFLQSAKVLDLIVFRPFGMTMPVRLEQLLKARSPRLTKVSESGS